MSSRVLYINWEKRWVTVNIMVTLLRWQASCTRTLKTVSQLNWGMFLMLRHCDQWTLWTFIAVTQSPHVDKLWFHFITGVLMFLCYLVAYFSPKLHCEFLSSPPTDNIQNPQTHQQFIQLHQTIKLCLCYQNKSLTGDARSARSYRDELDIVKEKASKVDKLERQLQSYKDKMHELDFYKARVDVRLYF